MNDEYAGHFFMYIYLSHSKGTFVSHDISINFSYFHSGTTNAASKRTGLHFICPRTPALAYAGPVPLDPRWLHVGSPHARPLCFSRVCMRPTNCSRWLWQRPEEGEGAADAQPTPGGGRDIEVKVRQQKSEDKDATPDLLLKHPDATLATYVWR
jgi:hypothetical protein